MYASFKGTLSLQSYGNELRMNGVPAAVVTMALPRHSFGTVKENHFHSIQCIIEFGLEIQRVQKVSIQLEPFKNIFSTRKVLYLDTTSFCI
jgi:hypothetical protein